MPRTKRIEPPKELQGPKELGEVARNLLEVSAGLTNVSKKLLKFAQKFSEVSEKGALRKHYNRIAAGSTTAHNTPAATAPRKRR